MGTAAIPKYLDTDLKRLPPGHRFGAYFPVWDVKSWTINTDGSKNDALKSVLEFSAFKKQMEALRNRQNAMAISLGDNMLRLPAQSVSPFVTGMGMEHPLENGFAFLNPYGLPYFPGSGVKGVLRCTAELLIEGEFNGDAQGWTQTVIDELFGPESQHEDDRAARGALIFWDVLIEPKDCKLDIDIFTPHFGDYYSGKDTPHESGQPAPIPFLVVPPGAAFIFSVQCIPALIDDDHIRNNWKTLLEILFQETFDWLGFGAKTAVGYGQMTMDRKSLERSREEREKANREAELEKLTPQQRRVIELHYRFGNAPVGEKDNPQGPLRLVLREMADEAVTWPAEDRKKLRELAEVMLVYWEADKTKKGKELLKKLE